MRAVEQVGRREFGTWLARPLLRRVGSAWDPVAGDTGYGFDYGSWYGA